MAAASTEFTAFLCWFCFLCIFLSLSVCLQCRMQSIAEKNMRSSRTSHISNNMWIYSSLFVPFFPVESVLNICALRMHFIYLFIWALAGEPCAYVCVCINAPFNWSTYKSRRPIQCAMRCHKKKPTARIIKLWKFQKKEAKKIFFSLKNDHHAFYIAHCSWNTIRNKFIRIHAVRSAYT